jgi:hypothetical protein
MKATRIGGSRIAAVSVSLCLVLLALSTMPASANIVIPINGGGDTPLGPCQRCNQQQTSGTATDGDASNNPDGSGSQFGINYDVPDDNTMYSGTVMTQVVNSDGTTTVNVFPISDYGSGASGYATSYNSSAIPIGGTGSITISESNGNGQSFSAGWVIRNFRP